jgi:hypothetical protein
MGQVATCSSLASIALHRPYFWNSQSRLSSGQTWRALSHLEMQWKWKACYTAVSNGGLYTWIGGCELSTYIANTPSDSALLTGGRRLVGLALDT